LLIRSQTNYEETTDFHLCVRNIGLCSLLTGT
jgi:hypothetical protein